jgi:hypothetical protein
MRAIFTFCILKVLLFSASAGFSKEVLYCFDFGGAFQDVAPGFTGIGRVYHSPRHLWIDNVREVARMECDDPLRRDFAGGPEGEFWIGLDNGDYELTMILGDPREAKGPFDIYVQHKLVQKQVTLKPGKHIKYTYPAKVEKHKLMFKLVAEDGEEFALNGIVVAGDPGKALCKIFKNAPTDLLPQVDDVFRKGLTDTRKALRTMCNWFLEKRLPNGFLGDYEPGKTVNHYYWYTSAYPIRSLLAGYDIFGEKKYLDAAVKIMDDLVDEQLPNGAWQQEFRGKPANDLTQAEIDHIYENEWMNMADIGSIATALGITANYVPEPRKSRYIKALQRFCDDWASTWQQPSGGFSNAMEAGIVRTKEYSVATATEAAAFTSLYIQTKNDKYLAVAEKAAHFLTDYWRPDGRPIWFNHEIIKEGRVLPQSVLNFGDSFYHIDGLFMVYHHTKHQALKDKIEKVYSWYIKGEKGLLASLGNDSWWLLQDAWNNSKTAGVPLALLNYQRMANDAGVNRTVSMVKRFLCTSEFSRIIGVMLEDADVPWGGHSLQAWAACTVSATGFAGLSIAEMIQPGVIYLKE